MRKAGVLRPITVTDLPRVGALFSRVFRGRRAAPSAELSAYLHDLLFTSPMHDVDKGGFAHERADGRIDSAFFSVPMRFMIGDRPVVAQVVSSLMADPDGSSGILDITMKLRPKRVDLCFTDSASPITKSLFATVGGALVPVQGLEWRRAFKPASFAARRFGRFLPLPARRATNALVALATPLDWALRALHPRFHAAQTKGLEDFEMSRADFIAQAPGFVARYAVRPEWSPEELGWLLAMTDGNKTLGPLRLLGVRNAQRRTIGCIAYYGAPGEIARVLNVLADEGMETAVLGRMFQRFDEDGMVGASGNVQPWLIEGLADQRALTFRHRAFVCISTRHPEIVEAAIRNDIYVGGLAGEGWSRLMSDFS
ncbi:GNAT family N-acetyltransferase [Chenggangzhangella methanolivorans]|uniref:GNAT family N-acetyltransferase n=1 Tax=Chenggangzhangella methanolivorans TaxID=1437009 RepID=A0A9E6UPA1_9HYPH|nr:GNAT family N-acetyltransferase [Chenggangzhangella methanolivorans]QZO01189.1 GNAT family N-acetyltransferase [Chenggangzhangella methanolivorans]